MASIEKYLYDPTLYARPGEASGDYSEEERQEIQTLRANYPELSAGWGDVAIATAWGDFSQTIHMTGWNDNLSRDDNFLLFLFLQQEQGNIAWGTDAASLQDMMAAYIKGEAAK